MLKKLMLLSVVMLTIGGSLQAVSKSEEIQAVKARRLDAAVKAARASGDTTREAYENLGEALFDLEVSLEMRDAEDEAFLKAYGERRHKPARDIEIDELRSKIDQAEAAVLVAK